MSEDSTHFELKLNGIVLEISGDRDFVDHMYRLVMRDLEEARERVRQGITTPPTTPSSARPVRPTDDPVVWLHRCTDMVHKIYMASSSDLGGTPLFQVLDPRHLGVFYVEDELFRRHLPQFERGQTLWAELTPAGRAQIREAGRQTRERQSRDQAP